MYITVTIIYPYNLAGYYRIEESLILPHDKAHRRFAKQHRDDEQRPFWEPFTPTEELVAAIKQELEGAL